jgi:hypothetical protein
LNWLEISLLAAKHQKQEIEIMKNKIRIGVIFGGRSVNTRYLSCLPVPYSL